MELFLSIVDLARRSMRRAWYIMFLKMLASLIRVLLCPSVLQEGHQWLQSTSVLTDHLKIMIKLRFRHT